MQDIKDSVQKVQESLTGRQRLLLECMLEKNSNGECLLPVEELVDRLHAEEEKDFQWLRDDLQSIRAASFWLPDKDGESLVTWIAKAFIDSKNRTVWVQLGDAACCV